jgi:hypothetical protein
VRRLNPAAVNTVAEDGMLKRDREVRQRSETETDASSTFLI